MGLLQLNISPYDPLVDVVQTDEIKIIDGENFLPIGMQYISVAGLRQLSSKFELGSRPILHRMNTTNNTQLILTTTKGVYRLDEKTFIPFKLIDAVEKDYNPWSIAFVGGMYYIAGGKGVPLYKYNLDSNELKISASSYTSPVACCSADGRLILINDTQMIWSAMDNGEDITPSLGTGAGYQTLGKVGGGTPISVCSIANGFLAFTSKGIISAKVVNASTIFFFNQLMLSGKAVQSKDKIVNLDDSTACFLTNNTLYLYDGSSTQTLIPNAIRYFYNTGRIEDTWLDYDPERSWLCLHTRDANFIYDIQLQSMGRVKLYDCLPKENYTVYNGCIYAIDSRDFLYTFTDEFFLIEPEDSPLQMDSKVMFYSYIAESFAGNPSDYFYGYAANREEIETSIQFTEDLVNNINVYKKSLTIDLSHPMTMTIWGDIVDLSKDKSIASVNGDIVDLSKDNLITDFFPIIAECSTSIKYIQIKPGSYSKTFIPAFIHIGSFRVNKELPIDNTIIISKLALFGGVNSSLDTFINMNTVPEDRIDMMIPVSPDTFVFMGVNPSDELNEDVEVRGTSDGKRELTTHYKKPTLLYNAQDRQEFAVYNTGIYHSIKVSSTEKAGIRLAQVQIDAFKGGRFYGETPVHIPH